MQNQPQSIDLVSSRIATHTAAVAAIFSLVVASLLLYDFFHRSPLWIKEHVQTSAQDVLKAALKEQPGNRPIVEEIRKLDQESRAEFFRQKALAYSGPGCYAGESSSRWRRPGGLPPCEGSIRKSCRSQRRAIGKQAGLRPRGGPSLDCSSCSPQRRLG